MGGIPGGGIIPGCGIIIGTARGGIIMAIVPIGGGTMPMAAIAAA
jgi:hypothetical protein